MEVIFYYVYHNSCYLITHRVKKIVSSFCRIFILNRKNNLHECKCTAFSSKMQICKLHCTYKPKHWKVLSKLLYLVLKSHMFEKIKKKMIHFSAYVSKILLQCCHLNYTYWRPNKPVFHNACSVTYPKSRRKIGNYACQSPFLMLWYLTEKCSYSHNYGCVQANCCACK